MDRTDASDQRARAGAGPATSTRRNVEYYARRFDTVEVNSTFYGVAPPLLAAMARR